MKKLALTRAVWHWLGPMILSATLSGLAYRFRLIVDGLRETVPEHQAKNPASCALVGVIWTSLGRRMERFARILARVEAGIPDPVWPSRGGRRIAAREADAGDDGAGVAEGKKPKLRMPTRAGWLMVMMPWVVAPYGTQLRHWLTDPDAQALVRSSRQMRRLLRPLLRSLSTDPLPECLLESAAKDVSTDAAGDAAPDCGREPGDGGAEAGQPIATEADASAPARTREPVRRRVARQTRRAPDAARAAPAYDVQAASAATAPPSACGFRSAPVDPPPRDWWSVQDERRRAALAIARGSVCRA